MSEGWIEAWQAALVPASTVEWKPGAESIKEKLEVFSHFYNVTLPLRESHVITPIREINT